MAKQVSEKFRSFCKERGISDSLVTPRQESKYRNGYGAVRLALGEPRRYIDVPLIDRDIYPWPNDGAGEPREWAGYGKVYPPYGNGRSS